MFLLIRFGQISSFFNMFNYSLKQMLRILALIFGLLNITGIYDCSICQEMIWGYQSLPHVVYAGTQLKYRSLCLWHWHVFCVIVWAFSDHNEIICLWRTTVQLNTRLEMLKQKCQNWCAQLNKTIRFMNLFVV